MSQRRFHRKSRHGCLQCKKNRTKCDESTPKCGRCERVGIDCSLSDESSGLLFIPTNPPETQQQTASYESPENKSTSSNLSNSNSIDSSEAVAISSSITSNVDQSTDDLHFKDEERERLRLMSHYALRTAMSITKLTLPKHQDQSVWGDWVIELAFKNDFLLYGLLSVSALHLALEGVSKQHHTVMAIQYHNLGVALFRPQLSAISKDNYDSIFAFSCMIALYSFGIQRITEPEIGSIEKVYQAMVLIRGTAIVVKHAHELLRQSHWNDVMFPSSLELIQTVPVEVEDMLSKLLQRVPAIAYSVSQEDTYNSAIQALRYNLTVAINYQDSRMTMTLFPVLSSGDFWLLVSNEEPLALSILANYAVILYWLRKELWMQGWGKETVDAVRQALSPVWHECIDWAIRETQGP